MPSLDRHHLGGVTLLTDASVGGGVTFAFTERTGGVSRPPYGSLNLGAACGDDPKDVSENRRRVLAALGGQELLANLVNPHQVHGDRVLVVRSAEPKELDEVRREAAEGADGIVCTACDVPVLLCFADCVPVVLTCPGGFAVLHSGWRGTIARIAARGVDILCRETGCEAREVLAYVGPHILAPDYEVSAELAERFAREFGSDVVVGERNLDLSRCLAHTLSEAGVPADHVAWCDASTASSVDRFFSYRAEHGSCGRHGAVALMRRRPWTWPAAGRERGEEEGEARL